jgi:hypothetical protein
MARKQETGEQRQIRLENNRETNAKKILQELENERGGGLKELRETWARKTSQEMEYAR